MIKFFRTNTFLVLLFALFLMSQTQNTMAAGWNGIIPLKTSREEVEKILGVPIARQEGTNTPLQFKVMGGIVTIAFVDENFITVSKLPKDVLGKVRQIVLQHDNSSTKPEDMKLDEKKEFVKEQKERVTTYRNEKDGITYTFIDGTLKTTYYFAAASQLSTGKKPWVY